jgi:hypothetical protein
MQTEESLVSPWHAGIVRRRNPPSAVVRFRSTFMHLTRSMKIFRVRMQRFSFQAACKARPRIWQVVYCRMFSYNSDSSEAGKLPESAHQMAVVQRKNPAVVVYHIREFRLRNYCSVHVCQRKRFALTVKTARAIDFAIDEYL